MKKTKVGACPKNPKNEKPRKRPSSENRMGGKPDKKARPYRTGIRFVSGPLDVDGKKTGNKGGGKREAEEKESEGR